MKTVLRWAFVLALAFAARPSAAAPLSDPEEAAVLEAENFWKTVHEYIPIGSVRVVGRGPGHFQSGEIDEDAFRRLKAWESQGIIKVQEEPSGGQDRSTLARVLVSATPGGIALHQGSVEETRRGLRLQVGTSRLSKVIRSEERKIGPDEYRVVTANLDSQWLPEFKAAMRLLQRPLSESRKGMFLMKRDPRQGRWGLMGGVYDTANRDEGFSTSNVDDYLAQQSFKAGQRR